MMRHVGDQSGVYCLNRGWRFIEKDVSVLPASVDHDEVYAYAKAGAQKGPAEIGFDDSGWEEVTLPHDWVTKKDFEPEASPNMGYKKRGIGWYRICFCLDEADRNKQIRLEFEGVSADACVYVNGMLLKRSFSGYNSFCVDMTDMAHFGIVPNVLAVHIDASAWEGWWYEGAGIYRNVWLIKKPAVHIAYQGVSVITDIEEETLGRLQMETVVENSFSDTAIVGVAYEITAPSGEVYEVEEERISIQEFSTATLRTQASVKNVMRWSLEKPVRYQVKTIVTAYRCTGEKEGEIWTQDVERCEVGFREIELNADTGFWLNGENIKLKGFCNHQDHAGVGVAVPYNLKEYRIKKLQELGANAYRCSHNPDPEILEICDRLGMLVMEENRTFSSAEETLDGLRGVVKRALCHPSVVLYSIFNEEPLQGTAKGARMAARMRAVIRELDKTRPVLGAFNGGYMEEDGAGSVLDAVGINYNPDRYDLFHAKYPHIPLIGSETASAFMVRGEYKTDMEAHVIDDYDSRCAAWGNSVREAWKAVAERPFVAGTFVWTGFDYRGEPTPFSWPSVATFFGTYDSCGFAKDACYLYKAFWTDTPMVHIASPWPDSRTHGETIKVMVDTNCEEVELYCNEQLQGRKTVDPYEQVTFTVTGSEGVLRAVGLTGGKAAAEETQYTAGPIEGLQIEPVQDSIRGNGHDAAIFNVSMTDGQGRRVPTADTLLHFSVENGEIIGVGNGDPNSHEPDVADVRRAFHGLAQVIVRPEAIGKLTLHVQADGLPEAESTVVVQKVEEIPCIAAVHNQAISGWTLYRKLFDEMPDPGMTMDKNDMNSFEPIAIAGRPQAELSGQLGKYAMFRAQDTFAAGMQQLQFCHVEGQVWIYVDGVQIGERTQAFSGEILCEPVMFSPGKHEITVIVKNANRQYPEAGIVRPVLCRQV